MSFSLLKSQLTKCSQHLRKLLLQLFLLTSFLLLWLDPFYLWVSLIFRILLPVKSNFICSYKFAWENHQYFDPFCLKFPLKSLLLFVVDQGTNVLVSNKQNFNFSHKIAYAEPNVIAIISAVNHQFPSIKYQTASILCFSLTDVNCLLILLSSSSQSYPFLKQIIHL